LLGVSILIALALLIPKLLRERGDGAGAMRPTGSAVVTDPTTPPGTDRASDAPLPSVGSTSTVKSTANVEAGSSASGGSGDAPSPASTSATSTSASTSTPATSTSSPKRAASVARPASPRFVSPIDQLPEGPLYRTAIAALDVGKTAQAKKAQEELMAMTQRPVLAQAIDGFALAKQGQFDEAIAIAQEVSKVPVMRGEAYLIAGEAFFKKGLWVDAIGAFEGAVETEPNNPRPHRWLGMIHYDLGAMYEAVRHLREVAKLDPSDLAALRLAGLIHRDYEKFEEAIADYEGVLGRGLPDETELKVRLELADSYRQLKRPEEALAAIADCPETADVLAIRGACKESAGETDEGLRLASRAIELDPRHELANLVAGRLHMANQSWPEAIAALKVALDVDPTDHATRYLLGRALVLSGDRDAGEAELAQAERLKGISLKLSELHLEALAKPQDAAVRLQMGKLAEELGRPQTALNWYRAALSLDGSSQTAADAIRRLSPNTQ
jgi:tetratricopeptide (TPR) repeat protein